MYKRKYSRKNHREIKYHDNVFFLIVDKTFFCEHCDNESLKFLRKYLLLDIVLMCFI